MECGNIVNTLNSLISKMVSTANGVLEKLEIFLSTFLPPSWVGPTIDFLQRFITNQLFYYVVLPFLTWGAILVGIRLMRPSKKTILTIFVANLEGDNRKKKNTTALVDYLNKNFGLNRWQQIPIRLWAFLTRQKTAKGIEVRRLRKTLKPLPTNNPKKFEAKLKERRELLADKNADVLVWGKYNLMSDKERARYELYFLPLHLQAEDLESAVTPIIVEFREGVNDALCAALVAQIVASISPLQDFSLSTIEGPTIDKKRLTELNVVLRPIVEQLRNFLEMENTALTGDNRSVVLMSFSLARLSLSAMEEKQDKIKGVEEAIGSTQEALEIWMPRDHGAEYASIRSLLGILYLILAPLKGGEDRGLSLFQAALKELSAAIEAWKGEGTLVLQSMTESLYGIVCVGLASRLAGSARQETLETATKAFASALPVLKRYSFKLQWALTQSIYGLALLGLAAQDTSKNRLKRLEDAAKAFELASLVWTKEDAKDQWREIQFYLGVVLLKLASIKSQSKRKKLLKGAIEAFTQSKSALNGKVPKPLDWIRIHNHIGHAYFRLASIRTGKPRAEELKKALEAFDEALETVNEAPDPSSQEQRELLRANSGAFRAFILHQLASLENRKRQSDAFKLALGAYGFALSSISINKMPEFWLRVSFGRALCLYEYFKHPECQDTSLLDEAIGTLDTILSRATELALNSEDIVQIESFRNRLLEISRRAKVGDDYLELLLNAKDRQLDFFHSFQLFPLSDKNANGVETKYHLRKIDEFELIELGLAKNAPTNHHQTKTSNRIDAVDLQIA